MITGAMKSTPTAGMERLLNITPIHLHIKKEAIACYARLKQTKTWRPKEGEPLWNRGHTHLITKLVKEIPELNKPNDKLTTTHRTSKNFITTIEDRSNIEKFRPKPYEENIINCFTDGSRSNGTTGAGYISMNSEFKEQDSIYLGKDATVFQAEIIAIMEASRNLLTKKINGKDIRIYIDSQSAIKALGHYESRSTCVLECKKMLNMLGTRNKVSLNWIPGHEGHMGNEVADRLAKRGGQMKPEGPEPYVPIGNRTKKGYIKEWAEKQYKKEWKARTDCRQTKIWLDEVNNKWSRELSETSRKDIRIFTQIITGHANLKRHRYIMGIEENPTCEKCGEGEETPEHLFTDCPFFAKLRLETLGVAFPRKSQIIESSPRTLINFAKRSRRLEH